MFPFRFCGWVCACVVVICLTKDTHTAYADAPVPAPASPLGDSQGNSFGSNCALFVPGRRVFALGDLHGDLTNTLLLLHVSGLLDFSSEKWIGGDSILVQTGDIVDRGPDGKKLYDFFDKLGALAQAHGGRVVQLIGNHDVMNICGDFRYVHPKETEEFGGTTLRRDAFKDSGTYGKMLRTFPPAFIINDVLFSHAGVPPEFAKLGLIQLREKIKKELENDCAVHNKKHMEEIMGYPSKSHKSDGQDPAENLFVAGNDGPMWTRIFSLAPPSEICASLLETLEILKVQKMVIGHTVQESGQISALCHGKLFLIDTGVSRYVANHPKILEIDSNGEFFEWGFSLENYPGKALTIDDVTPDRRKLHVPPLVYKHTDAHAEVFTETDAQKKMSEEL